MWALLFLTILVLTAGATWAYAVREQAIMLMTMLATTGWSLLALTGGQIDIYHQDGSVTTVAEPAFQYVATGLALLSFLALILWYFGEFPVNGSDTAENDGDRVDREGKPQSPGV